MEGFSQQVIGVLRDSKSAQATIFGLGHESPIRLWIIQVGIIICTASILASGLRKLHQPKVIAEVLGGILLGPTAFGRIPGFTENIFPEDSRPYLGLVANIGLCLFLFLVGLEIDLGVIKRNARLSATVALAGMILPFAIGASLSVAIYREFIDPSVKFTHFMLFTGIAYSITAFPVLCRILTELKLLDTTVGIVVLSAGVGNDIVGWTLLALSVALVNAGTGFAALHILLVCVAWTIVVLFPLRWSLSWLARSTGSIESGPTVFFMTVTMLVLFGSAFVTDIIGVHAIFGAFLAGIIVPREGGLAIALTEKLEDMVTIIFLPLYFTLSGLSTDLGLLDNAKIWAYTTAIIASAFVGKFGGCSLAARYVAGFDWRESTAIGSLMSCKGLVELIVLNVGLSAGILSRRVFSMFVLEALVLTFVTTPLVTWLYPPHLRTKLSASGSKQLANDGESQNHPRSRQGLRKSRFTVVLDKFEHLAGMMALTQLVTPTPSDLKKDASRPLSLVIPDADPDAVAVEALRIIELSDRVSAVMKSSAAEAMFRSDPLLSAFRMFGTLNQIDIDASLAIVPFSEMARTIAEQASNFGSDMILIPWLTPGQDAFGGNPQHTPHASPETNPLSASSTPKGPIHNPFDVLFKSSVHHGSASIIHSRFVRSVFAQSTTDVALFVDQSMLDSLTNGSYHLFLPFFGGPDDRLALEFILQLSQNPNVTATIVRISLQDEPSTALLSAGLKSPEDPNANTIASHFGGTIYPDTHYGDTDTARRLQSETADDFIWVQHSKVSNPSSPGASTSRGTDRSVQWKEISTLAPLHVALQEAQQAEYSTYDLPTSPLSEGLSSGPHSPTASSDSVIRRKGPAFVLQRPSELRSESFGVSPVEEREPLLPEGAGNGHTAEGTQEPSGPLIVVTGRSRRLAAMNHRVELKEIMGERGSLGSEVKKTLGDSASAFVGSGVGSGVLVIQASGFGGD